VRQHLPYRIELEVAIHIGVIDDIGYAETRDESWFRLVESEHAEDGHFGAKKARDGFE
jgi:hypothetical protein